MVIIGTNYMIAIAMLILPFVIASLYKVRMDDTPLG